MQDLTLPRRQKFRRALPLGRSVNRAHNDGMDDGDLQVRNATYAQFVEAARAPSAAEVAAAVGRPDTDVLSAWRRLHDAHALVLDTTGVHIQMANPFSAVQTTHRVNAGGRWWFANCAWDAFGICAALQTDGSIRTMCPDCGDELAVEVRSQQPSDPTLLFHCLVPARAWWDDIGFT